MKIIVCVKIIGGELNPFDECALEEALRIPGAEVTLLSMCPPTAKEKLLTLTRLGAKKAILLCDPVFAGSDTLATAYVLSEQLKKMEYDLILCGRQTTDGDTAQVGPCLATMLGIGLITNVMKLQCLDARVECITRLGEESARLPALLTVERINNLRFPSIRSKMGEVEILNNQALGADPARCGLHGSPTRVLKTFENTSGRRKCKWIKPEELKTVLESLPKEKQKVSVAESPVKLKSLWAIGREVAEKGKLLADEVILISDTTNVDPYALAERAKKEKPSVILWNADLLGRRNAPILSALLQTGLCADCTALETDGEKLFMYRPAKSGNIIAKIECATLPQMATVRIETPSDDIIVSGGKGVANEFDRLKEFAATLGAEVCASRALVDAGIAPYEMQVGLTGKNVSPRVYIAVGISGAVRHTCAIENAGTVIAINPDKDAPIFDSADYGILANFEEIEF